MVIWHPNVAVGDLGYREREVNQWRALQPEKLANTSTQQDVIWAVFALSHGSARTDNRKRVLTF